MKTILDRIREVTNHTVDIDMGADSIDKLILVAYCVGREEATQEVSDKYEALIASQRKRANAGRYHRLANEIIGKDDFIRFYEYDMGMTTCFGSDVTSF